MQSIYLRKWIREKMKRYFVLKYSIIKVFKLILKYTTWDGKKNVKGEKFRVMFEHGQHTNQTQQQQLTNYSKLFLCFTSAVNIINHFPDHGAGHGPGRPAPRSAPNETNAKNRTSRNSASELTNPLEMVKKTCQDLESLNSDVWART